VEAGGRAARPEEACAAPVPALLGDDFAVHPWPGSPPPSGGGRSGGGTSWRALYAAGNGWRRPRFAVHEIRPGEEFVSALAVGCTATSGVRGAGGALPGSQDIVLLSTSESLQVWSTGEVVQHRNKEWECSHSAFGATGHLDAALGANHGILY
jgi:hypothetical protein